MGATKFIFRIAVKYWINNSGLSMGCLKGSRKITLLEFFNIFVIPHTQSLDGKFSFFL